MYRILHLFLLLAVSLNIYASDPYFFNSSGISRKVLENYLERSATITEVLSLNPLTIDGPYLYKEDDIRLIENIGAKFIGRAFYRWGREDVLNNPEFLEFAKNMITRIHERDSDVVFQAALFEIVTERVNNIGIPSWAFEALGLPAENRNFKYEDMLNKDGKLVKHWSREASVPDITRSETKLWFMFLAGTYMEVGCEALHLGQTALIGMADTELTHWADFLDKLRKYATKTSRRGWVILDAHTPTGGMVINGKSLLDFNSFPLRIKEIPDKPQEAVLEMGYLDALFGRSKGCITPSGWSCESLPFLVEFDNFGCSSVTGKNTIDQHFIWGYDEISWFYKQNPSYRREWLKYAYNWVKEHDRNGFLQMPVSRVVSLCDGNGVKKFRANTKSGAMPDGLDLEETIKDLWR